MPNAESETEWTMARKVPAAMPCSTCRSRAITLQEFRQAALDRFSLLDKRHEGRLSLPELEALKPVFSANGKPPKHRDNEPDNRVGIPLPPGN